MNNRFARHTAGGPRAFPIRADGARIERVDDALSLMIRLLGYRDGRYGLNLSMRNSSAGRLLIPSPEVADFAFVSVADGREAQWGTYLFVSSRWVGLTLEPWEEREFPFRAIVCGATKFPVGPAETVDRADTFCVELAAGEYDVSYRMCVDEDYFDPDSHCRLPELRREALRWGAVVWIGEAVSNQVRIVHA